MTVKDYLDKLYSRFPYLKGVHSPKDVADLISYEEQKQHNKQFFKELNEAMEG